MPCIGLAIEASAFRRLRTLQLRAKRDARQCSENQAAIKRTSSGKQLKTWELRVQIDRLLVG
jgi:hypothetical protein